MINERNNDNIELVIETTDTNMADDLIAEKIAGIEVRKKFVFCDDINLAQQATNIITIVVPFVPAMLQMLQLWLQNRTKNNRSNKTTINNYIITDPEQIPIILEKINKQVHTDTRKNKHEK